MTNLKWFASFLLAVTMVPALLAETRCPGNVASVPLRLVNGYQMIVAVSVNHSGPYDFLLDTGTQFSMIDPTLATELHVKALQDSIPVAGMGFQSTASTAQLDYLAIGSRRRKSGGVVYNLQNLRSLVFKVRGRSGRGFSSTLRRVD